MLNLRNLPPGAIYTEHSGQATVNVGITRDTVYHDSIQYINEYIYVVGTCDSLQRLCTYYESELTRIRGQTIEASQDAAESKENTSLSLWQAVKWLAGGIVIGFFLTIILINIKQWK